MNSQTDMRKSLAVGWVSYQNTTKLPMAFDLNNTIEIRSTGNNFNTQLSKGLFHDTIALNLSFDYDGQEFSPIALQASTGFSTRFRGCTFGVDTSIGFNSLSVTPKLSFKIHDDVSFSLTSSISSSGSSFSVNTTWGLTYHLPRNSQFGIFFGAIHKDTSLNSTLMIMNLGLFGYSIKVPFFMGTLTEGPSGHWWDSEVAASAGIIAAANIVTYAAYKTYKKFAISKKYSKLDVDFRKYQEKLNELREKERQYMNDLLRNPVHQQSKS